MIKVTIGDVDMYGMNGRELHPERTDKGKVGELVKTERIVFDECYCVDNQPVPVYDPNCEYCAGSGSYPLQFLTVDLPDGRTVELVEYEVASLEVKL
jgi:hypothetical protein